MLARFFFKTEAGAILLGSLLISVSILAAGNAKIKTPETQLKDTQVAAAPIPLPTAVPSSEPGVPTGPVKVSVDDDPVLGEKDAQLTLIEFSDYECPFCKKSYQEILPDLKKNYIDTGKVKLVYRDLPLSFHQNSHKEAEAADCARDQGDDDTYYKFHNLIFDTTTSNGTGISLDQLPTFAKKLGLNVTKFQSCLDSGKFKDEVDKDIADAGKVGANGTPTWFLGKTTSDGVIEGTMIVGAQPFSSFKTAIDQQLSQ